MTRSRNHNLIWAKVKYGYTSIIHLSNGGEMNKKGVFVFLIALYSVNAFTEEQYFMRDGNLYDKQGHNLGTISRSGDGKKTDYLFDKDSKIVKHGSGTGEKGATIGYLSQSNTQRGTLLPKRAEEALAEERNRQSDKDLLRKDLQMAQEINNNPNDKRVVMLRPESSSNYYSGPPRIIELDNITLKGRFLAAQERIRQLIRLRETDPTLFNQVIEQYKKEFSGRSASEIGEALTDYDKQFKTLKSNDISLDKDGLMRLTKSSEAFTKDEGFDRIIRIASGNEKFKPAYTGPKIKMLGKTVVEFDFLGKVKSINGKRATANGVKGLAALGFGVLSLSSEASESANSVTESHEEEKPADFKKKSWVNEKNETGASK